MGIRGNVVVVDDEAAVRDLIVDLLKSLNGDISPFQFENAPSALEFIQQNPVDAIISDVNMEGITGLEFLQAIKREFPQTKCLIISGNPAHREMAFEFGADAFLEKPFRVGDFLEILRTF